MVGVRVGGGLLVCVVLWYCVCACRSRKERCVPRADSCAEDKRRTAVASSIKRLLAAAVKRYVNAKTVQGGVACLVVGSGGVRGVG